MTPLQLTVHDFRTLVSRNPSEADDYLMQLVRVMEPQEYNEFIRLYQKQYTPNV